jgi:hypothetical protein
VAWRLQIAKLEFSSDPGLHAAGTPQVAGLTRLLSLSQLHTLYWHNDPRALLPLDLPWGHLTVINLVPMWSPMSRILHLMEKAPKLRSLSTFITGPSLLVVRSLSLPDLVILWIGCEVDVGPLFKRLTVPSLQNINVFCVNSDPPIPQTDVVHCITHSGSVLRSAPCKSLHISNSDLILVCSTAPVVP